MNAKKLLTNFAFAFIAFVVFSGCAKDDFEPIEFVCPEVISTDPVNGATSVALNKTITATFNEVMNASTINSSSFIVMAGTTAVSGTVTYAGTTASFTPAALLAPNTVYTGRITTAAKDVSGNALQQDYVWSFSTSTIPTVIANDPLNLATGVVLNKVITATFSEAMLASTITAASTITLRQGTTVIPGTVAYTGTTATFTPSSNLIAGTVYTVTITTAAKNLAGNSIANNHVWTFTTSTIPRVISTDPLNLATGVALNKVVSATFSEAMTATSITTGSTFTLRQGTTIIPGTVAYGGFVATFTPTSNLLPGTTYTATITTAAKNLAGNSIANDYVWTFTTAAPIAPPTGGLCPNPAVDLGLAKNYAILAESGISTTGTTSVTGDMGISPAEATYITGFGLILNAGAAFSTSSLVTGQIYAPSYAAPTPANLTTAVNNMRTAYTTANGLAADVTELMAGNLNGQTLVSGVYKWGTGLSITNGITLDGGGVDCAKFIFQIAGDLTVANGAIITLTNGAKADNIYWVVAGSKAELGTTVQFQGNILSKTLISVNTGSTVNGRLLAQTAVTLNATSVVKPN